MTLKKVLPICVVGISVILCFCNWRAATWLSGWDTLHPEFNFPLYLKRIFFGAWQEHQGLGALAVQAHASDLPRMLIYFPLSLILPVPFLRFAYFFLTLAIGSLGMFYFLKHLLSDKKGIAGFVGSLFYLLNLGTLQIYYFPLEMFATLFATLPWLFLFVSKYLSGGRKKDLVMFLFFTLFSTPMAHTATLFYAYFGMLFLFILFQKSWKRGWFILFLTLAINSFWLLPNLYFVINNGQIVQNSKISTQFSETAFLTGKQFGNLKDTLLFKNYLFDWGKYDNSKNQFVGLLKPWKSHLDKFGVSVVGYLFAAAGLSGMFISIKEKNRKALAVLPVFLLAFLFIANDLPLFSVAFSVLQTKLPLFKEALRFPFTKFANFLFFSQAVFLAVFVDLISKVSKGCFAWIFGLVFCGLIIFYMWPAFGGNFINKDMRVSFPKEYFTAMDWLSSRKEQGRVAHFPLPLFWGWNYYRWGYEGAGFWWFGFPQPFLDREFDRWSPYNEQYYWEISYAVYSQNLRLFESVLNKYNVRYLLLDEQVINPSSPQAVYFEELKNLFSLSSQIKLAEDFNKIKIYEYSSENDFVTLYKNLPSIGPNYSWTNIDRAYLELGDYVLQGETLSAQGLTLKTDVYYPFRSLFTGRNPNELDFEISEKKDAYILRKEIPPELSGYSLKLAVYKDELLWIDPVNFTKYRYIIPLVYKDENVVEVVIPKTGGYLSKEIIPEKNFLLTTAETKEIDLSHLPHKFGYLISVESKNIEGRGLLFWIENLSGKRPDSQVYLPPSSNPLYFIQPPMENFGLGYRLHFDNISTGKEKTVNELGKVTVNPIPYNFLTGLNLVPPEGTDFVTLDKVHPCQPASVSHPDPSLYEIKLDEIADNSTLVLSQSFHKGWKAYLLEPGRQHLTPFFAPLFGKEIKDHVLVNNWANGWRLDRARDRDRVILVFWPQYLQYLGFGIAGLATTISLFWRVPGGQQV